MAGPGGLSLASLPARAASRHHHLARPVMGTETTQRPAPRTAPALVCFDITSADLMASVLATAAGHYGRSGAVMRARRLARGAPERSSSLAARAGFRDRCRIPAGV